MLYPSYCNPIKIRLLEDTGHENFHFTKPDITTPEKEAFLKSNYPLFWPIMLKCFSFLLGHTNLI